MQEVTVRVEKGHLLRGLVLSYLNYFMFCYFSTVFVYFLSVVTHT